jgi:hypothetical protein
VHWFPLNLQPDSTMPAAWAARMAQPPTLVPVLPVTVLLANRMVLPLAWMAAPVPNVREVLQMHVKQRMAEGRRLSREGQLVPQGLLVCK